MYKLIILLVVLIGASVALNSVISSTGEKHDEEQAKPKVSSKSPLTEQMFAAVHANDYKTIEKLIKKDPDIVNKLHAQGGTFINCAVTAGNTEMLTYLLEHGAHPDGNSKCGKNGMQLAVQNSNLKCAEILIKKGVTINKIVGKKTILDEAMAVRNKPMIKLLKDNGAKLAKELPKPKAEPKNVKTNKAKPVKKEQSGW